MASKTKKQHYVGGRSELRSRVKKQGRPQKDADLKIAHRITLNFTETEYQRAMRNAGGMKLRKFGVIAVCYFDRQLFAQKID